MAKNDTVKISEIMTLLHDLQARVDILESLVREMADSYENDGEIFEYTLEADAPSWGLTADGEVETLIPPR